LLIIGVELLHFAVFRFLRQSNLRILVAAPIFYLVGYELNLHLDIFNPLKGRIIGWNYFFIHEAVTLYGFYLLGIYLRRKRFLIDKLPTSRLLAGTVVSFLIVLFTYKLNTGPFNFHLYNDVVILFASHGHILLFPLTAVAGCAMILLLAKLSPQQAVLAWLGQNTLILMCLNGIFYHYINPQIAEWNLAALPDKGPVLFAVATLMTTVSLLTCMPFIHLFNRYIPQLVGKPKHKGPWLKNLLPVQ
jgi:acyltransferase